MHCHGDCYLFQHIERMVHVCTHTYLLHSPAYRRPADDVNGEMTRTSHRKPPTSAAQEEVLAP
jgi:hypothetical protein